MKRKVLFVAIATICLSLISCKTLQIPSNEGMKLFIDESKKKETKIEKVDNSSLLELCNYFTAWRDKGNNFPSFNLENSNLSSRFKENSLFKVKLKSYTVLEITISGNCKKDSFLEKREYSELKKITYLFPEEKNDSSQKLFRIFKEYEKENELIVIDLNTGIILVYFKHPKLFYDFGFSKNSMSITLEGEKITGPYYIKESGEEEATLSISLLYKVFGVVRDI